MGMRKGSKWKRLAIFSDAVNSDDAGRVAEVLRASSLEIEWRRLTIPATRYEVRPQEQRLGRAPHPLSEEWLFVRRGDYPLAFVIVKSLGVSL